MITATITLFEILGILTLIVIYITIIFTLKKHNDYLRRVDYEERQKAQMHFVWLDCIGLYETGNHFNAYGLDTRGRWELWGKMMKRI